MRGARLTGVAALAACSSLHRTGGEGIARPLTAAQLTAGAFVAYTLAWQVSVPGGDPVVFHSDGTITNLRAGLAGRWRIVNESTLVIGDSGPLSGPPRMFVQRRAPGDLFSDKVATWITRAGAPDPTRGSR